MVFKHIILIFFFNISLSYSNIIYDKNNISITDLELESFVKIQENYLDINVNNNKSLKDLILLKKTIDFFENTNPEFISTLDKKINSQFGEKTNFNIIEKDFLRFRIIRNEFIKEYFNSMFEVSDLENIFLIMNSPKLPISKNKCLTIEKTEELNNNKFFLESFLDNLKINQKQIKTKIDNVIYDVCISEKIYQEIDKNIYLYLENKTEIEFKNFIYSKIK